MVKEFSISLNEYTAEKFYVPGSAIAGSLTVEIDDPKSYKQISVHLKGEGFVSWSEQTATENDDYYSARETYVNERVVLWKSEESLDGYHPAGRYSYSFEFIIPANCPSSFPKNIWKYFGNIEYLIEGVISTGAFTLNHKVQHPFDVLELVSIDTSIMQASVREEKVKTVGGFLCCASSEIPFSGELEQTGFQVGDVIPVIYHVENRSGRRVSLRFELVEIINFFANGSRKTLTDSVAKHVSEYIPPHITSGEMYAKLVVPQLRPAMHCSNIIKSDFVLNVTLVVPYGINSVISLPVSIGNANIVQQDTFYNTF